MAVSTKSGGFWSHLHLGIRFVGLTGLFVAGVALVIALVDGLVTSAIIWETWETLLKYARQEPIERAPSLVISLLLGALVAGLFSLFVEILMVLRFVAGRRSAFGFNVVTQIALAVLLLIGINLYSAFGFDLTGYGLDFRTDPHYWRIDTTRGRQFTLPSDLPELPHLANQLRNLQGQTTIVVYQRHKTFGQLSDKPDGYDYAAERKVVEKVNDLVDQFRELGKQFTVIVLDVEEESYADKLNKLPPELKQALDQAPENSIFFHATTKKDDGKEVGKGGEGKVQRLSFNEFYQLDKTASREQHNLVLLNQGVVPFVRKVFNTDERKPRISVAVIHDVLSTQGLGDYGMEGVRKVLAVNGFEGRDIILKKWRGFRLIGPGVYTFAEGRYDRLNNELEIIKRNIKTLEAAVAKNAATLKEWATSSLKELTEKHAKELNVKEITQVIREDVLGDIDEFLREQQAGLDEIRKDRDDKLKEMNGLNVDDVVEMQRITDLQAKFQRLLADSDLLIIPRMTYRNLNLREMVPNSIQRLDEAQVTAIKEFMKAGKPILFCLGPTVEPPFAPPDAEGPDGVEKLLAELGVQFGKSVVLFDAETTSFAGQQADQEQVLGANVDVPPVEFDWKVGDRWPTGKASGLKENPIREAMSLAARSVGKNLDIRLRHPRPVYFEPSGSKPGFSPTFMTTTPAAWNEDQPFPTENRTPHFEEPKPGDPKKGTRDEKRHGPISIAVAAEVPVPVSWYDTKSIKPATVRIAAIGHGHLFSGPELSPAKEKLFVDTCNWLLGRDDHLTKSDRTWSYPRIELSPTNREYALWEWGAWLGLPAVFAYIGLMVLLVRRQR